MKIRRGGCVWIHPALGLHPIGRRSRVGIGVGQEATGSLDLIEAMIEHLDGGLVEEWLMTLVH